MAWFGTREEGAAGEAEHPEESAATPEGEAVAEGTEMSAESAQTSHYYSALLVERA